MSGEARECEVVGWGRFYDLARVVAQKILASGYRPDVVVGLTVGGWVLARVLSDFIGVKKMVSLKMEHWGEASDARPRLRYPYHEDLSGRRVLMVDDVADAERMRMAADYVRSLKPEEVRAAVLMRFEGSELLPDFYGDEIPRRRVILPWNFTRDLCRIVLEVAGEGADPREVGRRIRRDYGIDVDERRLPQILEEAERRSRGWRPSGPRRSGRSSPSGSRGSPP